MKKADKSKNESLVSSKQQDKINTGSHNNHNDDNHNNTKKHNQSKNDEIKNHFNDLSQLFDKIKKDLPNNEFAELESTDMYKEYMEMQEAITREAIKEMKMTKKVHPIVDMLFDVTLNQKRDEIKNRIIEEIKEAHND